MTPLLTKPKPGAIINPLHPLASGLVGFWLMNEGSGSKTYDISGNSNHGTIVNRPPWTGFKSGGAVDFNGVDQYIEIQHDDSFNNDYISISAWFISRRHYQYQELIRKGDNTGSQSFEIIMGYPTPDDIRFSVYVDSNWRHGGPVAIELNKLYHLVGTYDGSYIRLYLNGLEVGTPLAHSGVMTESPDIINIARRSTGDREFDGIIDHVRIYNRNLSVYDVKQLYQNPFADIITPSVLRLYSPTAPTGWTGTVNGVTNPSSICGVSVADIIKVNGVSST